MVNLLFAIHNHQPVGNFDNVFEEAYVKSYRPFIDVLERHPQIKLALHYTGSLLDWLAKHHPDFLSRIRRLVAGGQVEIFAGGYYEPILTLIPESDAVGQEKQLCAKIKELFGYEAKGSWIAERVWEPKMPRVLAAAGLEYGIVDDSHFSLVGFKPEALSGFYETEEQGSRFNLFPCSEQLRYAIPFGAVEKTIEYLARRHQEAPDVTITYGDDGEKFGLWPDTYEWVYTKNWLHRFFEILEQNASWIRTLTFKEYKSTHRSTQRVYIPCASYREMLEWSNGFYRNFMVKYPEINLMHKRMLYVSGKVETARRAASTEKGNGDMADEARRHLYMAQANDAYWHGVFGGLYLNHLRSAVYQNLIQAETLADKLVSKKYPQRIEAVDIDCDGAQEMIIRTQNANFYFKPNYGASLFAWDDKPKGWNLINTISRKEEVYHKKLKDKAVSLAEADLGEIASIHDRVVSKEEGLSDLLFYDKSQRYCLMDHFLSGDVGAEDFIKSRFQECGSFLTATYEVLANKKAASKYELEMAALGQIQGRNARLVKKIGAFDNGLTVRYNVQNMDPQSAIQSVLGVEFNFSVYDPKLVKPGVLSGQKKFQIDDAWNGFSISFDLEREADVIYYPVETVSDSEMGIEKSFQGVSCVFLWLVDLGALKEWSVDFKISV